MEKRRVRWQIDEKTCDRWKTFCSEGGYPVQTEVEKALAWWMELPSSMRDRLGGTPPCHVGLDRKYQ